MTAPTIALLCCPKCETFEEVDWAKYMRGLLPLCPEGCKSRMFKATPEQEEIYKGLPKE